MTKKCSEKHVKIVAFSQKSGNSSRREIRSSKSSTGKLPTLVLDKKSCPTLRTRYYFDIFRSTNRERMARMKLESGE